jgi:hypothetical protein
VTVAERRDLKLIEGNPETVRETITDDDTGLPLNLTGKTLNFYIKPSADVADTDPAVTKLSTTGGQITITDAVNGICTVAVPPQAAGTLWRRLDVVTAGQPKTAVWGPLYVLNV